MEEECTREAEYEGSGMRWWRRCGCCSQQSLIHLFIFSFIYSFKKWERIRSALFQSSFVHSLLFIVGLPSDAWLNH